MSANHFDHECSAIAVPIRRNLERFVQQRIAEEFEQQEFSRIDIATEHQSQRVCFATMVVVQVHGTICGGHERCFDDCPFSRECRGLIKLFPNRVQREEVVSSSRCAATLVKVNATRLKEAIDRPT